MPVGVMLRSMDSLEMTRWMAYYHVLHEARAPKGQTPKEARAVLNAMVKAKRRRR